MKVIPAIDLMDGQVVRLLQGKPENKTVYSSQPLEIAKSWEKAGADLLHIVDLDATLGSGTNLSLIKKITKEISIPIEIAGGLRTKTLVDYALSCSSRIVLGTLAFKEKAILKKILDEYGNKKIVISVDHMHGNIVINGWQNDIGIDLFDAMKDFLDMGFTEFLLTNVSKDGTLQGPDLENLKQACEFSKANVIASGGISNIDDVKQVKETNAFGVILGKALYENQVSIEEAKKIA